jgi:hypothetical protein
MPASGILEKAYYPNTDKIAAKIKDMLRNADAHVHTNQIS